MTVGNFVVWAAAADGQLLLILAVLPGKLCIRFYGTQRGGAMVAAWRAGPPAPGVHPAPLTGTTPPTVTAGR